MSEKGNESKKQSNDAIFIVVIMSILAVALIAVVALPNPNRSHSSSRSSSASSQRRSNQQVKQNNGPRRAVLPEVGRSYQFDTGWLASSIDEANVLSNLMGNPDALLARTRTSRWSTFVEGTMPIVVVDRRGGLSGPEMVRIQTPDGIQHWTLPGFLNYLP